MSDERVIPDTTPIARVEGGKFAPGVSANPNGKPAGIAAFRLKARAKVDHLVIDAWVTEIETRGEDWIKASELLTAYAYGRPAQSVAVSGPDESPIPIAIAAQVAHVIDPARALRLIRILATAGALPVGVGGVGGADDASDDEVRHAVADGPPDGVPSR